MLLAIDVGNTNISFGVYKDNNYLCDYRINTHPVRTADEYAALLSVLFKSKDVFFRDIDGIIICNVVPITNDALLRLSSKHFNIDNPIMLNANVDLGFDIKYTPKTAVGADRLANAVAAHEIYKQTTIVVDFGTATTFDVIANNGDYLGGAIVPGIQISLDALFAKASKLTEIELKKPEKAVGTNTEEALLSGVIYGYAGQLDAIVKKIIKELDEKEKPLVVATGGQSYIISEHSETINLVCDNLTLDGLNIIYQRLKDA